MEPGAIAPRETWTTALDLGLGDGVRAAARADVFSTAAHDWADAGRQLGVFQLAVVDVDAPVASASGVLEVEEADGRLRIVTSVGEFSFDLVSGDLTWRGPTMGATSCRRRCASASGSRWWTTTSRSLTTCGRPTTCRSCSPPCATCGGAARRHGPGRLRRPGGSAGVRLRHACPRLLAHRAGGHGHHQRDRRALRRLPRHHPARRPHPRGAERPARRRLVRPRAGGELPRLQGRQHGWLLVHHRRR